MVAAAEAIVAANARAGIDEPDVSLSVSETGVLGYARTMSVEAGGCIEFCIHSGGTPYRLDLLRLGWYGGRGARLVASLDNTGATQPDGVVRAAGEGGIGSTDCSNWYTTDVWRAPRDLTHGVYVGVVRSRGGARAARIGPFIVRTPVGDDAQIVCKLSDMTWQAYNAFGSLRDHTGGRSLYGDGAGVWAQDRRAWDVTYDRPLVIDEAVPQTTYWNGERPVHAWLERNGFDVAYVSALDVDADPGLLAGRRVVMSCGHDEYWSQPVREAWEAALRAGSHAVVMSGNTMLWRTRMAGRRMTCYKDSHTLDGLGAGRDPDSWTGTWRDTRWPGRRAECATIGSTFVANGIRDDVIHVPADFAAEPLWRDTAIAQCRDGVTTLRPSSLGFEWDTYAPDYLATLGYPLGLKLLSRTLVDLTDNAADENGSVYSHTINPAVHHIVAFRHRDSGSVTVNFGTNQWGWGLADLHVRGTAGIDVAMQQATANLLVDLGCEPASLQPDLVAPQPRLGSWDWPTLVGLSVTPSVVQLAPASAYQLRAFARWSNGILTDATDHVAWACDDGATVVRGHLTVSGEPRRMAAVARIGAQSGKTLVEVRIPRPSTSRFRALARRIPYLPAIRARLR